MAKLTSEDKLRIKRLYTDGQLSASKIAEIYELSAPAVVYTLKKMSVHIRPSVRVKKDIPPKKSVDSIRREIAERNAKIAPMILKWYNDGLGCHAIKTMLRERGYKRGTDHTAIIRILHANNVKVRPQGAGGKRSLIPRYIPKGVFCS